jgi:hypothetical protein
VSEESPLASPTDTYPKAGPYICPPVSKDAAGTEADRAHDVSNNAFFIMFDV